MIRPGLALSSLDKVLWPATGFTKGQLLDYYAGVAETILPHLADRPLTLGRFPDGLSGRGFAQTECRGRPEWMESVALRLRDGRIRNFCLARDRDSLLWIANLGTIELHIFLGTATALAQPASVLFDLDPEPPASLSDAARVALVLRERLARRGLSAVVKTTGGSGLHILVPLNCSHTYAETRAFAREVAQELAAEDERIVASATQCEGRRGTVLIDWAQNNEQRSLVAPYSLRATDLPSASTPVSWAEVQRAGGSLRFAPAQVLERIARHGDLAQPLLSVVQALHLG